MRIEYIPPDPPKDFISRVKNKCSKMMVEGLEERIYKLDRRREAKVEEFHKANGNALYAQMELEKLRSKKDLTGEEFRKLLRLNSKLVKAKEKHKDAEKTIRKIENKKRRCEKILERFS